MTGYLKFLNQLKKKKSILLRKVYFFKRFQKLIILLSIWAEFFTVGGIFVVGSDPSIMDYQEFTWIPDFKFWTRLFAFHIGLIPLGKRCIQWYGWETKWSDLPCLRNSPMSQVLFGYTTRWSEESASLTKRSLSWPDVVVPSSRWANRASLLYIPNVRRGSRFHLFAIWTFTFVLWIFVTLV